MSSLINRSTLAVLLAPAVAAGLFSARDFFLRPATGGAFTPFYFAFGYAIGLPVAGLTILYMKATNRTALRHFAYFGLQAGVIVAVVMAVIGFMWLEAAFGISVIGPIVGVFVWFVSEWLPSRPQEDESQGRGSAA